MANPGPAAICRLHYRRWRVGRGLPHTLAHLPVTRPEPPHSRSISGCQSIGMIVFPVESSTSVPVPIRTEDQQADHLHSAESPNMHCCEDFTAPVPSHEHVSRAPHRDIRRVVKSSY
jgi:hypothetical protein